MGTYVVLLGPPGAGKGTQAEMISSRYGLQHVSTGDLFRENIRNQTELGKQVQAYLDKGMLVPDSVTIAMVEDRISRDDCKAGVLLDGFPRTIAQAEALDEMLAKSFSAKVDVVPVIDVAHESLISRICGRRMCSNGHVFHIESKPPKQEGICDICGEALYQRKDDSEETLRTRLEAYDAMTAPLVDYYTRKNAVLNVNGNQTIDEVSAFISEALDRILNA